MTNVTKRIIYLSLFCSLLVIIYAYTFSKSLKGWGYAGYGKDRTRTGHYGYFLGPSIFYLGGARYYNNSSVRRDSLTGPSRNGRGPRAGK